MKSLIINLTPDEQPQSLQQQRQRVSDRIVGLYQRIDDLTRRLERADIERKHAERFDDWEALSIAAQNTGRINREIASTKSEIEQAQRSFYTLMRDSEVTGNTK